MLSPISRLISAVVCATALGVLSWFWTVPAVMTPSTFAFIGVFVLGAAGVTLMTWQNAQATGSTAQLLHETEVGTPGHGRV